MKYSFVVLRILIALICGARTCLAADEPAAGNPTQSPAAPMPASVAPPAETRVAPIGALVTVIGSSSLHRLNDSDHSADLNFLFKPFWRISERFTLAAQFVVIKDLENLRELTFENSRLSLSHRAIILNPFLKVTPSMSGVMPTNRDSYRGETFRGSVGLKQATELGLERIGLEPLSFSLATGVSRHFHEFRTSYSGDSNTQYSLSTEFGASWSILKSLNLDVTYSRGFGWTYEGAVKNGFRWAEELTWGLTPWLSVSVGHSNGGDAYKENGVDSRVSLFNAQDSTVFGTVGFKF